MNYVLFLIACIHRRKARSLQNDSALTGVGIAIRGKWLSDSD
jgi:hypothetical protein